MYFKKGEINAYSFNFHQKLGVRGHKATYGNPLNYFYKMLEYKYLPYVVESSWTNGFVNVHIKLILRFYRVQKKITFSNLLRKTVDNGNRHFRRFRRLRR